MELGQILMVIGIIGLIDSVVILSFQNWTLKVRKRWMNKKTIKKIGWIEFLIAVILFVVGMNI